MHNSKKQQSFLQTGKAPQQKAAMIDFIFKRNPEIDFGTSTPNKFGLPARAYRKTNQLLRQENSATISEAYQHILNLKKKLDSISFKDDKFSLPEERSKNISDKDRASPLLHDQTIKESGSENDLDQADVASCAITPIRTAAKKNTSEKLETLGCLTDSHQSDFCAVEEDLKLPSSRTTSVDATAAKLSKIQSCHTQNAKN